MESRASILIMALIFFATLLISGQASAKHKPPWARTIDPIVTTEWLAGEIGAEDLVILDIRSPSEYATGHIPGSINEPFVTAFDPLTGPSSNWIVGEAKEGGLWGLWLEVPKSSDLFETLGNLGITKDSRVVIVTAPNPNPEAEPPFYGLANGTRVAFTLVYAGVKNVALLDGGYPKWEVDFPAEIDQDATLPVPGEYRGKVNKAMLVSRQYVRKSIRKADILDARDADVYFGVTIEPFADKAGHITSAKSLPAPWIWLMDQDGNYLYKDAETLGAMASGVLRDSWGRCWDRSQEIIVYCGVGGYASSWWFVLTQVLGYQDVKLYDGAAQEWVKYYDMVPYQWE